ncbi:type III toxin-antitoxin system ToxN/AbiQ family toxin [Butyrivibrio sp. JL13D10]|uniref:type III toxin-antitoxin system ToxN/AbiQ family toxin n=1 Tax=Butyrivibrio sp. JL13D10 TaxID=3236815 RepID=UPI0038B5EE1D
MKLYSISDEYIKYLRGKFPRVYSNKEDVRTHTRKYLGVVLTIGDHNYYIPLSSPKDKHDYIVVDGKKTIRKDSLIVMRIVSKSGDAEELKGTLQIGTMIPVPDSEIELYDVEGEKDQAYKDLVLEELIYIRKNEDKIIKNARILYSKKKADDKNNKVVANCLDFIAAEAECDKWIDDHKPVSDLN